MKDLMIAAALAALCSAAAGAQAEDVSVSAADRQLRAALIKVYDFDYKERPLAEVLSDIAARAGIEIVLDPKALEGREIPVTWSSKKSSAGRALRWVTRLADAEFRVMDGAVFVSTPEELVGEVVLEVYDTRDLSEPPRDHPAPDISFNPPGLIDTFTDVVLEAGSIAEMIQSRIKPDSWAAELGTSIEDRDGLLFVMQRPEVHELVQAFIAALRSMRRRLVRVEIAVVASSAGQKALAAPAGDAVFAQGELATLDGLVAHAIWGKKTHYVAARHLEWPEVTMPDRYYQTIDHEVIRNDEGAPKVIVVKTPAPPPPPGEGKVVPTMGALLDGVLVEVRPQLDAGGDAAELSLRLVVSHPRNLPETESVTGEEIATPTVDYARLMTTVSLPVGEWSRVGKMALRRDGKDVPVDVLARVAVAQ